MTPFDLAQRYVGVIREETGKTKNNPQIVFWSQLCDKSVTTDEVPWCSAFVNGIAWTFRFQRSKSLAARSWLLVGEPIALRDAVARDAAHMDVVILKRGKSPQPGPEIIKAQGHVGIYAGCDPIRSEVRIVGGNQSDGVTLAVFPIADVLGVRRVRV